MDPYHTAHNSEEPESTGNSESDNFVNIEDTECLIFPKSEPSPRLFDRLASEDHHGSDLRHAIEDDKRPQWKRHVCLLKKDKELELYAQARAGNRIARDELIKAYWPLCAAVAAKYRRHLDKEDAESAAMVGLISAIDSRDFDPDRGFRLGTFVRWRMRTKINEARALQAVVYTPRGRPPAAMVSLDAPVAPGSTKTFLDDVTAENPLGPHPDDTRIKTDDDARKDAALKIALDELSDRERQVIHQRVLTDKPKLLPDLGAELGVSGERVRQIQKKATAKVFSAAPAILTILERNGIYTATEYKALIASANMSPENATKVLQDDGAKKYIFRRRGADDNRRHVWRQWTLSRTEGGALYAAGFLTEREAEELAAGGTVHAAERRRTNALKRWQDSWLCRTEYEVRDRYGIAGSVIDWGNRFDPPMPAPIMNQFGSPVWNILHLTSWAVTHDRLIKRRAARKELEAALQHHAALKRREAEVAKILENVSLILVTTERRPPAMLTSKSRRAA